MLSLLRPFVRRDQLIGLSFASLQRLFAKDAGKNKKSSKDQRSCKRVTKKKQCTKHLAPYPSYSECKRKPNPSKSDSECDCRDK